jgi:hypothetical protein
MSAGPRIREAHEPRTVSMWTNLLARRPIPESGSTSAEAWEARRHHGLLRLTSSPVLGTAAAIGLLIYLLSGIAAIFVLVLLLVIGFVAAFAFWGGLKAWTAAGRPTRPDSRL